ncbi:hypothetical protein BU25DRAFT_463927 [Macroventuria anomochaeta]|uniref:Uncharacterized protein n=1 Tax=Macroventuria anomochaeta TaxID=301207 RepID=A0ACB6RIG7_9PLEO|nr:uncharacterized protein BU25DRAFT_463927 [Macroventuria anomochaeta]KAF2621147.1 hypothetical protein BU25DRAFT_463927 [Macroventuria anomochaeta]
MFTDPSFPKFLGFIGDVLSALLQLFALLLLVVVVGTLAAAVGRGIIEIYVRIFYSERFVVGRITKFAKKLYHEHTAIAVKTKRNINEMDYHQDL